MEENQQSSRLDLDVISGEENGYPMKVYVAGYVDEEEICWQLDRMDAYDFGMQLIAEVGGLSVRHTPTRPCVSSALLVSSNHAGRTRGRLASRARMTPLSSHS